MSYLSSYQLKNCFCFHPIVIFLFRYWGALGIAGRPNYQLDHDSKTFRGSLGSFHGNINNAGREGPQATHTCPAGDHAQFLCQSGLWWRLFVGLNAKTP